MLYIDPPLTRIATTAQHTIHSPGTSSGSAGRQGQRGRWLNIFAPFVRDSVRLPCVRIHTSERAEWTTPYANVNDLCEWTSLRNHQSISIDDDNQAFIGIGWSTVR